MSPRAATFSGRRASQAQHELEAFIAFLEGQRVRRYLEIGARHGDTFHAVMSALGAGAFGVAVDLPGGAWGRDGTQVALEAAVADLRTKWNCTCRVVLGDSQDEGVVASVGALGPFDAVLIDGDHRYPGVHADWLNYGPMAPVVAFHDISGDGEHTHDDRMLPVEVPRLWRELRAGYAHVEFVDDGFRMGIGVIMRGVKPCT